MVERRELQNFEDTVTLLKGAQIGHNFIKRERYSKVSKQEKEDSEMSLVLSAVCLFI